MQRQVRRASPMVGVDAGADPSLSDRVGSLGSYGEGIDCADVPQVRVDVVGIVVVTAPTADHELHTQSPDGLGNSGISNDALGTTLQFDIDLKPVGSRGLPTGRANMWASHPS